MQEIRQAAAPPGRHNFRANQVHEKSPRNGNCQKVKADKAAHTASKILARAVIGKSKENWSPRICAQLPVC
jgi:hypothetical protein